MQRADSEAPDAPRYFNFATDVFDRWAKERPDSAALWCVHAASGLEERFSFAELKALSCQAANFFRSCGIARGDRVLLMLPRLPQWWISMLGLIRLGAVPVPATLLLTARDVSYRTEAARISAVLTSAEGISKLEGFNGIRILVASGRLNQQKAGVNGASLPPGWIDFESGMNDASKRFRHERIPAEDPGILFFTSATTGEPKMVLHTQTSYGLGHRLTGQYWLDLKPGDLHWNISDLGWGKAAWSSFYGPWHMGACLFALDVPGKFDPVQTLDILARYPITTWCAPPTALRLLVREDLSKWSFPHLRHCVTAGEPLNPEVLTRWRAATGLVLHEGYGQTETVVLVGNFPSVGSPIRPGSMGLPTPGLTIALLDEHLQEVPPGQEGEVALKVKPHRPIGLFAGYWLNPQEDAHKFRGDWYLTGDRAVRDTDGYFWFVGRKDDVIKSSGYRIGPFEVESALLEHRAVLDVAVVGKPDPLRGQLVKACVVLRPGVDATDELKTELQSHCKKLIAPYKYPREIEFLRELPKTTSGKTRHVVLRQLAAAS
jgi:acyl-coenzyme A synthetase/AMP-(fatty) acid ligase